MRETDREKEKKKRKETDGENKDNTEHFGLFFWTLGEISRASSANMVSDCELL